jgi:hypothetical protein
MHKKSRRKAGFFCMADTIGVQLMWWAVQGSNLRPLPCEGNALPLS